MGSVTGLFGVMAARVAYVLCLAALIFGMVLVVITLRQKTVVEEEISIEFDLESDFSYKYFDMMEKERQRDVSTFEARKGLLDDVCEKYTDPFRPENRALYHTHPPMNHFSFFQYQGQSNMMCSILKGGSNSWKIFMQRVDEEMRNNPVKVDKKVRPTNESERLTSPVGLGALCQAPKLCRLDTPLRESSQPT